MQDHPHRSLFAFIAGAISIVCLLSASQAWAAKPQLSATFGVVGHQVNVSGTLSNGTVKSAPPPKRWRAVLEEQVGDKWSSRASGKLHLTKARSFALSWVAPASQTGARVRVRVRAGSLTIQAGQAHRIVFSGAGGTPGADTRPGTTPLLETMPPSETTPPPPQITTISDNEVLNLPSGGDNTLVLDGTPPLSPGDFLTTPPGTNVPSGFLLKVLGSTVTGGHTHVQTEPASLYEAVPNGSIAADLGNLASATPLNADARTFSRALRAASASGNTNVPFDQHVSCGGSTEMNFSGSLDASLAPHLDLQWHKVIGIPTSIDHAVATVDANLSADAQAGVSAAASCELEEVTLFDPKWTVLVEVGPVLVPVTIDIPIKASASASASGSIQVSAEANMQGSLGIQYDNGDVSGIKTLTKSASVTHAVETQATLQARIGPGIGIEAGWNVPVLGDLAATAGVDVSSGLKLTYDPGQSPPGKLCVPITAEGQMSLTIPGASDIDAGPVTLYDENIWCEWIGAVLLHWQGTVDFVRFPFVYEHEGWTWTYGATETWNVDGHLLEGRQDGFFRLPYSSTWHSTLQGSHPCSGGGAATQTDVGEGSGGLGLEDAWDGFTTFGIYSAATGDGERSYFFLGGPYGSTHTDWTECSGSSGSDDTTGLHSPGIQCLTNYGPQAHEGVKVQGSSDCGAPGLIQVTWDLTATCPDGKAPNTEWMCDPNG